VTAKPIPAKLRALVLARDGYACARCGKLLHGDYYSLHHRLPRGRGGTHTAENLVTLCGSATTGCHHMVESYRTRATIEGWLVSSGFDPAHYAIVRSGIWSQPTATGWEPALARQ
jgi:HNH endonuclease